MNRKTSNHVSYTVAVLTAAVYFVISSCTGDKYTAPEFPVEREDKWTILSEEMFVNLVYDLWEYKSYLLVPVADPQTGHNLWIYDKNTGRRVWSGINDGRGPGETIGGIRNTYFKDGILTYYDDMKGSILRYDVDSLLNGVFSYTEELYDEPLWTAMMVECGDNRLYVKNVGFASPDRHRVSRFELLDSVCDTLGLYDFWPVEDIYERFYMYNTALYSTSSDKTKLVIGTFHGAIMEIYEVENEIRPLAVRYYYEPDIDVYYGGYDYNSRTVLGFYDLYAVDDRIYSAYDGELNPYWNGGDRQTFTKIAVFDWEGNPVELIHTDYRIDKIVYSEAENTIYAAVRDRDGIMYLAKMEL